MDPLGAVDRELLLLDEEAVECWIDAVALELAAAATEVAATVLVAAAALVTADVAPLPGPPEDYINDTHTSQLVKQPPRCTEGMEENRAFTYAPGLATTLMTASATGPRDGRCEGNRGQRGNNSDGLDHCSG